MYLDAVAYFLALTLETPGPTTGKSANSNPESRAASEPTNSRRSHYQWQRPALNAPEIALTLGFSFPRIPAKSSHQRSSSHLFSTRRTHQKTLGCHANLRISRKLDVRTVDSGAILKEKKCPPGFYSHLPLVWIILDCACAKNKLKIGKCIIMVEKCSSAIEEELAASWRRNANECASSET